MQARLRYCRRNPLVDEVWRFASVMMTASVVAVKEAWQGEVRGIDRVRRRRIMPIYIMLPDFMKTLLIRRIGPLRAGVVGSITMIAPALVFYVWLFSPVFSSSDTQPEPTAETSTGCQLSSLWFLGFQLLVYIVVAFAALLWECWR